MSPSRLALLVVLPFALFSGRAFAADSGAAQPSQGATLREQQAAKAFEEGVERFRRADYKAAAEAFSRADELAPSDDALANAIAAARRSNDQLLVLRLGERALGRESSSPQLAANAREAIAQAERHVVRLELSCIATVSCTLAVDGTTVAPGTVHVLPGLHTVLAVTKAQQTAEKRIDTVPGATYRVALEPAQNEPPPAPTQPVKRTPLAEVRDTRPPTKPLPPALFWVAVGITGGLTGTTAWSGMDTLSARKALPDPPTRSEVADVEDRIFRTDVLFIATLVVAAATTYTGFALVDWGSTSPSTARALAFSF